MDHEDGLNEVRRGKLVFSDELAQGGGATSAAGPVDGGEGHKGKTREQ
jgi:hypothetical protein